MRTGVLSVAVLLLTGTQAQAISDADKCEAAKNKIAGKYAFCRQKAEAKAIKTGALADYTKCDEKYSFKWGLAETNGGGMCPTNGDQSAMQSFITTNANTVAAALSGAGLPTCGDNAINAAGEQCDGTDLGGETCVTLGFSGGTLACSSCKFDMSGCTGCTPSGGPFPATGQTTAYGTGSDGDVKAGAALSYTDNGDGTITDNNTGLMWEKKSDDGSIHDWDNVYTWGITSAPYTMNGTMVTTFLDTLNDGGGGASCFAGHCDWRIPNIKELQSIVNYETYFPAVNAAFNTACAPTCTVLTCSCTKSGLTWSSTTSHDMQNPYTPAWYVHFFHGGVLAESKLIPSYVRAVRGGL